MGFIVILLNFVVPRFASDLRGSHMKIPLPTQIMLQASNIVQNWWWLVALVIAAIADRRFPPLHRHRQSGRLWWDTCRLKMPLLGDALRKAETARFARAMSTLVANTVPLVQSHRTSPAPS